MIFQAALLLRMVHVPQLLLATARLTYLPGAVGTDLAVCASLPTRAGRARPSVACRAAASGWCLSARLSALATGGVRTFCCLSTCVRPSPIVRRRGQTSSRATVATACSSQRRRLGSGRPARYGTCILTGGSGERRVLPGCGIHADLHVCMDTGAVLAVATGRQPRSLLPVPILTPRLLLLLLPPLLPLLSF